jgi:hypothetical protein
LLKRGNSDIGITFFDYCATCQPTVCVSRWWAGRDSLREQKKLEARKMLENGAESHQSAARFVGWLERKTRNLRKDTTTNLINF